jgi:3-hydroxyisobutyrate dehydrogenase
MITIGFIGLGHMGLPMALNLLKSGYQVVGYDISSDSRAAFLKGGGTVASGLDELALGSAVIFTMLQTPAQVLDVCVGEQGIYKSMRLSALHIDCSTIGVDAARHLHQEARAYQLQSLEAPVSGGVRGAELGTLTLMVAGDESLFEVHRHLLSCVGKTLIYTGGPGTGQAAKLCNNMLLGISMIAVSEAFLLGEKLGLSHQKLHEVVTQSSGQCWSISVHAPVPEVVPDSPANRDYRPGFSTKMMLKDLKLSQESAMQAGLNTALGALATEIYTQEESRIGDLDFSAIITCIA